MDNQVEQKFETRNNAKQTIESRSVGYSTCNHTDKDTQKRIYEYENDMSDCIDSTPPFKKRKVNLSQQSLKITIYEEKCDGDITTCLHLKELSEIMVKYKDDKDESYLNELYCNILNILNNFHHLLYEHDANEDFEYIHKLIDMKCKVCHCRIIRRNRRDRNHVKHNYNETANLFVPKKKGDSKMDICYDIIVIKEILDTIHCHYQHTYDMGYRLTKHENQMIYHNDSDKNKLLKLNEIVTTKRDIFYQSIDSSFSKTNNTKYITNLGKPATEAKSANTAQYSQGFPLYYWEYHKNMESKYDNIHYVPCKYSNLKEELTKNEISTISVNQFILELKKAQKNIDTDHAKTIHADVNNYCHFLRKSHKHPKHYGLTDSSSFSLHHLICILIYCNYDEFQRQVSATLRKKNHTEEIESLIERNSNFHFFCKYLSESINVFGTKRINGKVRTFYHGINQNMLFKKTSTYIYNVLSTTSSFPVAVNFTNNKGLVLELSPATALKYFSCSWLSAFSNEQEKLFIGGIQGFTFTNITNTNIGWDFEKYIKAISVIDTMTNGIFAQPDTMIYDKLWVVSHWNPLLVGATELHEKYQSLVIKLIENELKIKKYDNIPEYINNLFHYICINKKEFRINWKSMNVNISTKWEKGDGGYVGFKFCKDLFFSRKYESINFNFIEKLYPNLTHIQIRNLPFFWFRFIFNQQAVGSATLDHILDYLSNNRKSKIENIKLYAIRDSILLSSIDKAIISYKQRFQSINYDICNHQHEIYHQVHPDGWKGIEIKALK